MRRSARALARCSALAGGLAALGCGGTPPSAATAPTSAPPPIVAPPGWKMETWQAGQGLPPGARPSRPAPPPGTAPEVSGTAEVVCQEVQGGAGSEKYFEKVLQVEGVLAPLPAGRVGTSRVRFLLAGVPKPYSTEGWNVAGVPAAGEEAKFQALPAGRKVRVVGFVTSTGGEVGLLNCTVTDIGPGPPPTPVRPVGEVLAALAKGEAAAKAGLGVTDGAPAVLLLSGKVLESSRSGDTGTFRLAGPDGSSAVVAMPVNQYVAPPAAGKAITAGGLFDGYDAKSKTLKLKYGTAIP